MNAKTQYKTQFAADLAKFMSQWNAVEAKAREVAPNASEEEIYQMVNGALEWSLKRCLSTQK